MADLKANNLNSSPRFSTPHSIPPSVFVILFIETRPVADWMPSGSAKTGNTILVVQHLHEQRARCGACEKMMHHGVDACDSVVRGWCVLWPADMASCRGFGHQRFLVSGSADEMLQIHHVSIAAGADAAGGDGGGRGRCCTGGTPRLRCLHDARGSGIVRVACLRAAPLVFAEVKARKIYERTA